MISFHSAEGSSTECKMHLAGVLCCLAHSEMFEKGGK